jgi:hypothetical protein
MDRHASGRIAAHQLARQARIGLESMHLASAPDELVGPGAEIRADVERDGAWLGPSVELGDLRFERAAERAPETPVDIGPAREYGPLGRVFQRLGRVRQSIETIPDRLEHHLPPGPRRRT